MVAGARILALIGSAVLVSLLTITGSRAAFIDTTDNGPNNFSSGTVDLVDDDAGAVMFDVSGMEPGTSAVRCITVTYQGTVTPAAVKLYGAVGGTGLADYLNTTVEVGTGGSFGSCTGFTPTSTLFSGTLSGFGTAHTNFTNGLAAFTAAANPTSATFRFTHTLQDNNLAQGKTATATYTWEAQS